MKKILFFVMTASLSVAVYFLFINSITPENVEKQYESESAKNMAVYSPVLPSNLNFSGEIIPIHNYDVKESLDNEMLANTFWHSQMIRFLKRANRYFPIIEPILKKNNIPDDFKYLAVAESALTNVVSPAKATGFWQILNKTGKEFGLVINKEVDERYDLEKSTQAACNYLNQSYKKFGNWTLVAASYNMGMGGLSRSLKKQEVNNYYDLLLNSETARYVYRIVAIKTIMEHPEAYGYNIRKKDLYPTIPVEKIRVDSTITDLTAWSFKQGVNYKILKNLNPWLRKPYLTNSEKRIYQIRIPVKGFREFTNPVLESDSIIKELN